MQKIKWAKALPWIICAFGLVLLVYAGYMFFSQSADYSKSSELYENTNEKFVIPVEEKVTVAEKIGWRDLADVDIAKLREINDDVVGWIYFENGEISYPVMYSGDNTKYFRKTYTGETLSAGSIFIEGKNSKDFSDAHTIIYGHHMKDLSMFGKLEYYVTQRNYITDHEYFQIITENAKYRYRIFTYRIVEEDSEVYTVFKDGSEDFVDFVNEIILNGSLYADECAIGFNDKVITLSTCFNDSRLVVSAVRCDE